MNRKTTVFTACLLLLPVQLSAQELSPSGLMPATLPYSTEVSELPSSSTLPYEPSLPQTAERPVLNSFGDVDDKGIGYNDGKENENAYSDAAVSDGICLLIVLVILYGMIARWSGTQMTRITRMCANLYNKGIVICANLCHSRSGSRNSGTFNLFESGTDSVAPNGDLHVDPV